MNLIPFISEMEGLKAEFASLASFIPPDAASTVFALHKDKNRYHNIPCYDHSRVVLKYNVPPETDYIHVSLLRLESGESEHESIQANWISDTNHMKLGCRFICSQAPTDATTNDFWRMVCI